MSKRVVDSDLYGKKTTFSKIANLISLLSVVGILLYIVITWKNIPKIIPGHYNIAGEIDKYSSKNSICILLAVQILLFTMMSVLERFPNIWNTGVKINDKNREVVYTTLRNMQAYLKMMIMGYFSYMTFKSIGGENLNSISVFIFLVLVFGGMAIFLVKIFKSR